MGLKRGLRGVLAAAAVVGATASGFQPTAASAAGANPGISVLNELRALAGLPPVTENAGMTDGAAKHSRYMVMNGVISHSEDPGKPGYTPEGDLAARQSNLSVSSSSGMTARQAVEDLMSAPFHGIGFIDPRLRSSGAALYTDAAKAPWRSGYTINVIGGRAASPPAGTSYPILWPGKGATVKIDSYDGGERPDPLSSCAGYTAPTGLPIYVQLPAPEGVRSARLVDGAGRQLPICVFDAATYRNPNSAEQSLGRNALAARNAVVIIPRSPLTAGQRYNAELVTTARTARWWFAVGATNGTSGSTAPLKIARDIGNACPKGEVPGSKFLDIATSVHRAAIDCVTWWDVAAGTTLATFEPNRRLDRGQMASFIARLLEASGVRLPTSPGDHFDDDGESPHERRINQLAQLGIVGGTSATTFSPRATVTRGQIASFLVRSVEYVDGAPLTATRDFFFDDVDSPHQTAINKAAQAGLVTGLPDGSYGARAGVARGPLASMLARVLDLLVEKGHASPPR